MKPGSSLRGLERQNHRQLVDFRCKRNLRFFCPGRFQVKEPAVFNTIKEVPNAGLVWSSNPTGDAQNSGWVGGASVVRTVDGDGEAEGAGVFAAMAYGGGGKGLFLSFLFLFLAFLFWLPIC
jgi:hypothetical protein